MNLKRAALVGRLVGQFRLADGLVLLGGGLSGAGTSSVQHQEDEADEGRAGEDACLEPTGPSFASDGLHDHFEVCTDAVLSVRADGDRFFVRVRQ